MPKAINWPAQFKQQLLDDSEGERRMALRPKAIYFEHRYWTDGDIVDLRANGEVLRSARIVGEMKCCPINALLLDDLAAFLPGVMTMDALCDYLQVTYPECHAAEPISPETLVSVVYYENLPLLVEATVV